MFALSVITTVSLAGMVWFNSFQHDSYALTNPGKSLDDYPGYAQNSGFSPVALAGQGLSSLRATVYSALNLNGDSTEGTVDAKNHAVYPLPIAPDRKP